MFGRRCTIHVLAAVFALVVCVSASAQSAQGSGLPTVEDARTIVAALWNQREEALAMRDTTKIGAIESASAKQQDEAYLGWVRCGCERPKQRHTLNAVVPLVPQGATKPFFMAQVRTISDATRERVWYVVAVERDPAGAWRLAFVSWSSYKVAPPLQSLAGSAGYTAAITAQSYARMTQLARATATSISARNPHTATTSWGGRINHRVTVAPAKDGVFGLTLRSGKVLSCFELHSIDTYTSPSGVLLQGPGQTQWGYQLAPGSYSSITSDTAEVTCAVGTGVGSAAGDRIFSYEQRTVGTTGTSV